MLDALEAGTDPRASVVVRNAECDRSMIKLFEISLGSDTANVARGIFSALRELDQESIDAILVEGIDESEGDTAAAVMNRLRKAAEINVND